jgi:hypothetical protein
LNYAVGKFPPYADGYRDGTICLINECLADRELSDILIYPIVFLSRQYMELRMKEIIIALKYCNGQPEGFPKNHRLDQAWYRLKAEYEALGESTNDDAFENAEKIILEFASIDPISMVFRYPVDKNGNTIANPGLINIRDFGEVMQRFSRFLDALSDQIAHYADVTNDMYRDLYVHYQ